MAGADLRVWHEFYALAGTIAATLMGLTFVVVTLAPRVIARNAEGPVRAFTTPIVAFFATTIIVSLVMVVPDLPAYAAGCALGIAGFIGMAYMYSTGVHKRWRELELGIDDWFWYFSLPMAAYALLFGSGVALFRALHGSLYAASAGSFLLIVIGMRNAWDVVIAVTRQEQDQKDASAEDKPR